jgi:pSer/pThr/pTyr-binding forkhead associated (FHA) protein
MSEFGRLVPRGGGDVIPLLHERLTVGRRDSCDICLRFPNVSSLHCELTFQNGCWVIQDNNSKNGVKINGDKLTTKKVLHPGDLVSIAKHDFVIEYNLSASKEALDDIMEEVEGIIEKPLLEKAGLARPRSAPSRPPSGKLNLPPLTLNDSFDDDE